jgi:preprotein translocase subunit YajC
VCAQLPSGRSSLASFERLVYDVHFTLLLQTANPAIAQTLMFLAIGGIFYFLLFLPMQRQKKQTQKMLAALENGQVVVTSGGIVGTIVAIDNDTVVLRVKPDNLKLQFARSAVSTLVATEVKK